MARIITKLVSASLGCLVLFGVVGSANASVREKAANLYNTTKLWAPLNLSNDSVVYIDPYSIFKVEDRVWDINLTSINNNNEYDPNSTFTYRILCKGPYYSPAGWRVNGVFNLYHGPLGMTLGPEYTKLVPNTIIFTAKDYVCGVSNSGSMYYYAYSYFRDNQIRGIIDQIWFKENVVEISQDDPNLRRTHLMLSVLGGTQANFSDWFVKCDKREFMEAVNSITTTDWSPVIPASGQEVIFEKMCSNRFNYITYQTVPITLPAPKPAPEPSPDANVQPLASSDIDDAKKKCADLGFVRGTPKFGQCVLKVSE